MIFHIFLLKFEKIKLEKVLFYTLNSENQNTVEKERKQDLSVFDVVTKQIILLVN